MRVPSNPKDPGFVRPPWQSFSDWWTPNSKAHQTCIDLSVEWQAFIGRRINQDLHLFRELCAAGSPNDALHAWSVFWRQAVLDYGEEYSAIAKLAASFVPDRVTPGASADALPRPPQSKAA